jgi:mannose/fructose-specific phosphotransferase system component IIA
MSEPVRGIVVTHADLAEALVHCVERIAGEKGALVPLSNDGVSPADLRIQVLQAAGREPAIVFVDLASGSCALAGRAVGHDSDRIAVLTGVNLPMLLDFVFHRELALPELASRLVEKARAGTRAYGPDGPSGESQE